MPYMNVGLNLKFKYKLSQRLRSNIIYIFIRYLNFIKRVLKQSRVCNLSEILILRERNRMSITAGACQRF